MKTASFFKSAENKNVICFLCPHNCHISNGKIGICGARKNINGILYSLNYGYITGISIDPIEKKPFYHYYPGSKILSVGTAGCNMHCMFCQNYQISRFFDNNQKGYPEETYSPGALYDLAASTVPGKENIIKGLAYTYSEPNVWFEYVYDTSIILNEKGFKNVLVTNGFINGEPLAKLLPFIDAANIDIKAFTEENYFRLGGKLSNVKNAVLQYKNAGKHIELTTLIVTGLNDNLDEIENITRWISSIDKSIPYHLSRYFPQYLYNKPPTDLEFMQKAYRLAAAYLDYVYLGNTGDESNTFCPACGNILVNRSGSYIILTGIKSGSCSKCGRKSDIILQ